MAASLLQAFSDWMRDHPSTAPRIVAVFLSVLGDFIAQASTKSRTKGAAWGLFEWNFYSPSRIAIWSYCMTPVINLWLEFLESTFGSGDDVVTVLKKLIADQAGCGPLLMLGFFLYVSILDALMRRATLSEGIATVRREAWPAYRSSVVYWVPVSLSLFTVVPAHLKILVINLAGLGWNCLLALRMQAAGTGKPSRGRAKAQ